jgi:two-component system, cell cycle response regulator
MPLVFTVDDSSTIRAIITQQMTELGFRVEEAEDGAIGLAKLKDHTPDLILLDVTMPNMDGPTMLAKLREGGNRTPVIMLTSESKRSVVAGAIKLGIEDYILKPFKPDELRGKVLKALRMESGGKPAEATLADTSAAGPVDILVIDDMPNVHKKLRTMLAPSVTMHGAATVREALQLCHDHQFKLVLIDMVIPDVNSTALMNQLRVLQPSAVMVALALRTANDLASEVKSQGFHDALFKPFDANALDELIARHLESTSVLATDDNVLACSAFEGKDERLDRYFSRLRTGTCETIEKLASACYDAVILDLRVVPLRNQEKVVRYVIETEREARKLGLVLVLVGTPELKRVMGTIVETKAVPFFATVDEARGVG